MKAIFTFLILISSLTSFSQSDKVIGDYTLKLETVENNQFEYKLNIAPDGTFYFHYYSNIKHGIPPEVNKYGKGKWTIENNVISFFSNTQKDMDEKHTLDFTNPKTSISIKHPRKKKPKNLKKTKKP